MNMKKIIGGIAVGLLLIVDLFLSLEAWRYAEANNVAGVLWIIFLVVLSFGGFSFCVDVFFEKKNELGK